MEDKIRLGGMALVNGVLVHGPNSWACAIRGRDGELKVASDYKRLRASRVSNPAAARPGQDGRGLRAPAASAAPTARGSAPVPAASGAGGDGRHRTGRTRGEGDPQPEPACPRARRRHPLARPGGAGDARLRRSRPTTAPSTSRSAATSTASDALASTSAVARTCSARSWSARRSAERSQHAPPLVFAPRRALPRNSEHWRLRRRSSAGWRATPSIGSRARWPGPATSSSTGSRPRSRPPSSSRSPRRPSLPVSSWSETPVERD